MKKEQVNKKIEPGFKGKIKGFFRLNFAKVFISGLIIFYIFYLFVMDFYGPIYSLVPFFLSLPLALIFRLIGPFGLIFVIPYIYLIACVIYSLFSLTKKIKWIWIFFILAFFVLAGLDEPLINKFNKPNYSCNVDSDCIVRDTINGWCGNTKCVNKDWNYYGSLVNRVFALSCIPSDLLSCSCVENTCKTQNVYESSNLQDCEQFAGEFKERCLLVVGYNANRSLE